MFTSLRARLAGRPNLGRPLGRRGAVAVLVGVSFVPMMVGTVAVIDVSRMIATKAALQRIADNAALSGAAMYKAYTATDAFKTLAVNMATSSFCNAVSNLPGGFTLAPTAGSAQACGGSSTNGPFVTGQITAYQVGSRGIINNSGCSATNTVVSVGKCGFAVTVNATATMTSLSASLLGNSTVTITSTAINPFLDLSKALAVKSLSAAANANSIWVYPVLLDDDGNPDFSTSYGALPDRSSCSGDPYQINCGVYTMLATNFPANQGKTCTNIAPCSFGTGFVGDYEAIINPVASKAVITATTPLGFAFATAANASNTWYDRRITTAATPGHNNGFGGTWPINFVDPTTGCVYPFQAVYGTATQMYDASGHPLVPWSLVTHWYFSSLMAHNLSPQQAYLDQQNSVATYTIRGVVHNVHDQAIPPVEDALASAERAIENISAKCLSTGVDASGFPAYPDSKYIYQRPIFNTASSPYETIKSNCALTIVRNPDPKNPAQYPDGSYIDTRSQGQYYPPPFKTCWNPAEPSLLNGAVNPAATPGRDYAIVQCGQFKGQSFTFLWNDASGKIDDTDYGNGTLVVNCTGKSQVVLID